MGDSVRVNQNMYSWGSIVLKLPNGDRFYGFNSVSFADKRERVKVYGMGRHHAPRGRTRGKYSTDPVKLSGPKGTVHAFRLALATLATDGRSIGDVEFTANVQFVETGELPMDVLIERCVLSSDSSSHEENPDPLKDEIELDCMLIRRNGMTLFDSSTGAP